MGWLLLATLPFAVHDTFSLTFHEVVTYPAFGESDTFQGTLAFMAPDRAFLQVVVPESQRVWIVGDTAWVEAGGDVIRETTPLKPGLFLLEARDTLIVHPEGFEAVFGPSLHPDIVEARLWFSRTGVPESLRVITRDAEFHFRFTDFRPRASIPPLPHLPGTSSGSPSSNPSEDGAPREDGNEGF